MELIAPDGQSLILSDDLFWQDEFNYSSLAQTEPERTLSGSFFVQQGIKLAARPITLVSPDNMAWHTRKVVQILQNYASLPESIFTLKMHGKTYHVLLVKVEASPVLGYGSLRDNDYFKVNIQLITAA